LISQLSFSERADKISDSLIILEAYKKWGEEAPAYLIGDFVFAIWDKCERKLFAARDPLGVKHFYYYFEPGKLFALASEIKALFQIKGLRRELDEQQLADYLVVNSEDKESTFFRNIKRLPATHTLTVEKKDLRIRQYWQPKFEEIRLKSDGEYHEAFREKFTQAVTSRLRSAFPVGSFLSGGLDSSAIVCIAAEYLKARGKPPLETFSAVFPKVAETDKRIDERAFMQAVIDKTGCRAHFVEVDNDNPLREMEKICWYADHPVGAPNVYMDWEIYRAARDKGVRILLSGTDGDSTVGYGYEDFAQLVQRRMFFRLFRDAFALHKNIPCRSHRPKQLIWHRGFKPVAPPALLRLWRVLRRHKPEDPEKPQVHFPLHFSCVRREIRRAFELEDRIDRLYRKNYPPEASAAENHWRGLTSGHFSFTLEQLEKISAAFGIEQRYPFFDRRLIEFCIALPPGQRIYKGWTRSIFRHAMAGILPPEVQWRKDKSNLGAGIKLNLLKYGSREIEEALNLSSDVLEKYVDVEVLRKAYRDYQSDPLNKDREALLILSNVYLSKWLRQAGFA
jgi:asparagine synthase (glutamine-hydrolysing)